MAGIDEDEPLNKKAPVITHDLLWQTNDKETEIVGGGKIFRNCSHDQIAWAQAVSSSSFSQGVITTQIKINRGKEYGGLCSNTQVGFLCGEKEAFISGDGCINVGNVPKENIKQAEFSIGNIITLTLDFNAKQFIWQVEDKATLTELFPSDWTGEIRFFGKVIQQEDNLSFIHQNEDSSSTLVGNDKIPLPPATWNSNQDYFSSQMKFDENGKLCYTEKIGSWECAGIELPPGRYYFNFQITHPPQNSTQQTDFMFGLTHTKSNKKFSGYPGTGSRDFSQTNSGQHFQDSISFWVDYEKDEVTSLKINTFKKKIVFSYPKSKGGLKKKATFENWPNDANVILLVSMLSKVAVRIL